MEAGGIADHGEIEALGDRLGVAGHDARPLRRRERGIASTGLADHDKALHAQLLQVLGVSAPDRAEADDRAAELLVLLHT